MNGTLRTRVLAMLLLAASTLAGAEERWPVFSVTPNSIAGMWLGHYAYDSGKIKPVAFCVVLQSDAAGAITGKLLEPNTFGPTDSATLTSLVTGARAGDGYDLVFTYDGQDRVAHAVANHLRFTGDGRTMAGTWRIGAAWSGTVSLRKIMDGHREKALGQD